MILGMKPRLYPKRARSDASPRLARPLTDVAARKATPRAASYTLAAGGGLYLRIAPTGVKTWEVRYRRPDGSRLAQARMAGTGTDQLPSQDGLR
jgi:hypothetical protein